MLLRASLVYSPAPRNVLAPMIDGLEFFRIRFGGRPLWLTIAIFLILAVGRRRDRLTRLGPPWTSAAALLIAAAGVVGLVAYPAVAVWYGTDAHFFDNAEPTIVSIAWIYQLGYPLYHMVDSAERYAHIYGPVTFIVHGAALAWIGPSIQVSKMVGVTAGLASMAFVFGAIRRYCPTARSIILTGVYALLLLTFRNYSFWTRPESLQLLAVSVALYFAEARQRPGSLLAVSIASGLLWNLKLTGPLYSLPVFAVLTRRFGARSALFAVVAATAVALAPFALLSNVSLNNYMTWVRLSGHTGLLLSTLRQNIEWAAFLCMPLLLARFVRSEPSCDEALGRALPATLLTGISGVIVAAAKPGAGAYHLLPFIPTIMYLLGRRAAAWRFEITDRFAPKAVVAYVLVLLLLGTAQQAQLITTMRSRRSVHDAEDLVRFLSTHPGTVEMGYGRTEELSLLRPMLTFRNDSYLIDQPAVREHQLQGVEVPHTTIEAVAQCHVNYWLVPKGEAPFSGVNSYAAVFLRPLYPAQLRDAFAATHVLVGRTEYYDVWQCRGGPSK
jgi:hypothetical protein